MRVVSLPVDVPVALVERRTATQACERVLVFREGLVPLCVLALLRLVLADV